MVYKYTFYRLVISFWIISVFYPKKKSKPFWATDFWLVISFWFISVFDPKRKSSLFEKLIFDCSLVFGSYWLVFDPKRKAILLENLIGHYFFGSYRWKKIKPGRGFLSPGAFRARNWQKEITFLTDYPSYIYNQTTTNILGLLSILHFKLDLTKQIIRLIYSFLEDQKNLSYIICSPPLRDECSVQDLTSI